MVKTERPLLPGMEQRPLQNNLHHQNTPSAQCSQGSTSVQEVALQLLTLGYSVLPTNRDKTPTRSWKQYQEQAMTAETASKVFHNDCSLALIGGAVSGNLECLDFDKPELYQPFMDTLEGVNQKLAACLVKRKTPSGGYHIIYRCFDRVEGNKKLAMSANGKETWIETRGEGGYFLTSPSPGYTLIEHSLKDIPVVTGEERDVLHLLAVSFSEVQDTAPKKHNGKTTGERPGDDYNNQVTDTVWHNLLKSAGWQFSGKITAGGEHLTRPGKSRGTSATFKDDCLYVFSSNAGLPTGPHSAFSVYAHLKHSGDYQAAAKDLAKQGYGSNRHSNENSKANSPKEWALPHPFPPRGGIPEAPYLIEMLPEAVQTAAAEVARFAKVPEASPAVVGLSCIAAAIGKKAVVVERPGLEHHPAMFHVLIAASGERKTPAFDNMTGPFALWAQRQQDEFEEQKREAGANNRMVDAAIKGVETKARKEGADLDHIQREISDLEGKRINPPVFPSLFTTDATEQRLFQKMHERDGAYAVMSGEGRPIFDAIMGKYSGDNKTGDAIYLAGISGDTITRDRVGGDKGPEEKYIYKPCLNVCAMVQPDKYLQTASCLALRESGAIARIWPVWLPSLVGQRFEKKGEQGLSQEKMDGYTELIKAILQAQPPEDSDGKAICHKAYLSEGASEARRVFHNSIEKNMTESEDLEDVRPIASKAVTQTVKLALIFHIALNPSFLIQAESFISEETWAQAQNLGTYHLQEAVRMQRLADEDAKLESARRILRWIEDKGISELTITMLSQKGPRPRPAAEHAGKLLKLLHEYGYVQPAPQQGTRKPVWQVNPLWLASHSSQNSQGEGQK